MKFTTISALALFAISSVSAAPVAEAEPGRNCYRPGQPCMRKREAFPIARDVALMIREAFAEPIAEAEAEADPRANCYRAGEPCVGKREALPEPRVNCYRPGEPCGMKRDLALALRDIFATIDGDEEELFVPEVEASD